MDSRNYYTNPITDFVYRSSLVILVIVVLCVIIFLYVGWRESKARKKRKEDAFKFLEAEAMSGTKADDLTDFPVSEQSLIAHDIPNNPALAVYMQDLPQVVQSVADARHLAAKIGADSLVGLWQTAVEMVIELIKPNERLYAMTWNAHCVTTNRSDSRSKESHGVVFFSNMRFFHYKGPVDIIEFPLKDIYTVEARKGQFFDGISFFTPKLHVQLSFPGAIERELFRDMVIYIAASAVCPSQLAPDTMHCECPGCGATVIIHEGFKNKCDFCNRFVEKKAMPPDIAQEIEKYKELLESGAINEQEFEKVRSKLQNGITNEQ